MDNEQMPDSDTNEKETGETPSTAEPQTPRTGPVWEHRGSANALAAFFQTAADVLFRPRATFSTMRTSPGIGAAYLFYVLPNGVSFLISRALEGMGRAFFALFMPPEAISSGGEGVLINSLVILLVLVAPFLYAALTHLLLVVVNGQRYGYAATFRAGAYSSGSAALFSWIPCLGWLAAPIWGVVVTVIGLAAIHGTSLGKAAFAVILSGVIMGVVAVLLVVTAWVMGLLEAPIPPIQV